MFVFTDSGATSCWHHEEKCRIEELQSAEPQLELKLFTAECEAVRLRINTSKSEAMVLGGQWVQYLLQVRD